MKSWFALPIAFLLLVGAVGAQCSLHSSRRNSEPMLAAGAFAALGGLRSIVAEVIWFRADRLQDEGRYVELAQLASMLTAMEPHTPEVWSYSAWNLAYNVSVMMSTPADRWRWVHAGLRLLRDEGLVLNPQDPELHRELAWLFEIKLGANVDSASDFYRERWKDIVMDVKRRNAWEELKMDPTEMARLEQASGCTDWTDPQLSAMYWAARGVRFSSGKTRDLLLEIIRQAKTIYDKRH